MKTHTEKGSPQRWSFFSESRFAESATENPRSHFFVSLKSFIYNGNNAQEALRLASSRHLCVQYGSPPAAVHTPSCVAEVKRSRSNELRKLLTGYPNEKE
jgi:hypothetical protein